MHNKTFVVLKRQKQGCNYFGILAYKTLFGWKWKWTITANRPINVRNIFFCVCVYMTNSFFEPWNIREHIKTWRFHSGWRFLSNWSLGFHPSFDIVWCDIPPVWYTWLLKFRCTNLFLDNVLNNEQPCNHISPPSIPSHWKNSLNALK